MPKKQLLYTKKQVPSLWIVQFFHKKVPEDFSDEMDTVTYFYQNVSGVS